MNRSSSIPRPLVPVVRMRGVRVTYGDTVALTGLDLRLDRGTITALVGPSGSGKSTLAKLLPRFNDPCEGSVELYGVDLRRIDPARVVSARRVCLPGLAPVVGDEHSRQHSSRSSRAPTTRRCATPPAKPRFCRGSRSCRADSIRWSARTRRFRAGERQRVCIARAILADRPILVLDEATASADPENEARIQEALSEVARGRTVLVIAHRLSTIRGADAIVVLDGGRIAESGRHSELLENNGIYARLWEQERNTERGVAEQLEVGR